MYDFSHYSFEKCLTLLILHEYSNLRLLETATAKKNRLFALILTQHRLWGTLLMPYIIISETNKAYYRLSEALSPFPNIDTLATLAPEERETVNILNDYSDRNLFKLFSKNATVKEFLEKVTPDRIEDFIRPFIESRIYRCLSLARDEAIPVYLQKAKINTMHLEDRLLISGEPAHPVFRFNKSEEQSTYNLSLELGGKLISLRKTAIDIMCTSPCVIREGNNIFFISDVDGSKLKPFITKENVLIPKNAEIKYFASFVLNAVNNFRVEGTGFSVIDEEPEKEAQLFVETGLKGTPVLVLKYSYSGSEIYPTDTAVSFTRFENDNGHYSYRKCQRDFAWEAGCVRTLGELGFYSEDEANFTLDGLTGDKKQDLYDTIEAVNRYWSDFSNAGFRVVTSRLDRNYNLLPVTLGISHRIIDDWFDLKATVKIGRFEIPFIRLRRNILDSIREFELVHKVQEHI
jgi:hypothetical protein